MGEADALKRIDAASAGKGRSTEEPEMAASIPERWAEQARYDLDTARAMLESGRYLYVLFCCQQAVEKMLKGVIVTKTEELPPRVHNLTRLVECAGLELDEDKIVFLRRLSEYYLQSRYPEQAAELAAHATRELAQEALNQSETTIQWLSSML